jgi:DNA-directed RNA polymerase specialized sigma54-like protein
MKNRLYQKDVMLNLRLTKGQKDALDYVADQIHGLPTSKVLREVVKQYIATLEKEGYFTDYAQRQTLHNEYEPEIRRVWSNRADYEYA